MSSRTTIYFGHDGELIPIVFTWDAFSELHRTYGEDYNSVLGKLFSGSPEHLPHVSSVVTEFTADELRAMGIPVVPFVNALYEAYELAWFGKDRREVAPETEGKKNLPRRLLRWFRATLTGGSRRDKST